jgi:hypothetical protein
LNENTFQELAVLPSSGKIPGIGIIPSHQTQQVRYSYPGIGAELAPQHCFHSRTETWKKSKKVEIQNVK